VINIYNIEIITLRHAQNLTHVDNLIFTDLFDSEKSILHIL